MCVKQSVAAKQHTLQIIALHVTIHCSWYLQTVAPGGAGFGTTLGLFDSSLMIAGMGKWVVVTSLGRSMVTGGGATTGE